MRLALYTDLALRLLMYLAVLRPGDLVKTTDVARVFGVSAHHLQKAVQGLVRAGYVDALQGRNGGVRLAREAGSMRLGDIVADVEGTGCLIDCQKGPCPLAGRCVLKTALDAAERRFFDELNRHTLADVASGSTGALLRSLISSSPTLEIRTAS
jgi:Rrf2 family nitric oxide-sensitive transcriptional repressor